MTEADINHRIDNAVHLTLAGWKPIADLRLDLDTQAGKILCYEGEIRQVLHNLISNATQAITARHAAPDGLIVVRTQRGQDELQITVQDNGCGMDTATRARIFDPFFTTDPWATRRPRPQPGLHQHRHPPRRQHRRPHRSRRRQHLHHHPAHQPHACPAAARLRLTGAPPMADDPDGDKASPVRAVSCARC